MSKWWRRRRKETLHVAAESGSVRVERIDHRNFLAATSGGVIAVDFWAPWCGPCRAFAPVFEDVAGTYCDRMAFGKCNVDENGSVAALVGIQSIPTVVLFGPDGSELDRVSGLLSRRQLERLLGKALEQANW